MKFVAGPCAASVVVIVLTCSVLAQQTPPPGNPAPPTAQQQGPPATPPSDASQSPSDNPEKTKKDETKDKGPLGVIVPDKDKDKDKDKNAGTSNDRLFYALPNFLSLENGANVPPLTTAQKYKVVARGSFDYVQYPWYGFLAAISQAENSEPGYGQGWGGYGKRFGAAFADGTIENFFTGAILPSILHQDPRFFQLGHGSFTHRAFYAVTRNFVTRTDSGGSQFNYSEIIGGGMSAFISTYSYHPSADRTVSNAVSVWGTQLGYDTITIVVKEFWPDIHRKISHKHKADSAGPVK
jgi:hypothetical protein